MSDLIQETNPPNEAAEISEALVANPGLSTLNTIWQLFVFIVATVFVVFLAYFSLRLMGGSKNKGKGRNIKVIEAAGIGYNNNAVLVSVGDKCFLVGVGRGGVMPIGEINPDSLGELPSAPNMPFEKHLMKFFKKGNKDAEGNND